MYLMQEAVRKSDAPLHVKYLQTLVECLSMLGKVAAAGAIIWYAFMFGYLSVHNYHFVLIWKVALEINVTSDTNMNCFWFQQKVD